MKLKSTDKPYNKRGTYKCEVCGEKFRLGSTLWTHRHKHHRDVEVSLKS